MNIQRYDLEPGSESMQRFPDGDYVLHTDNLEAVKQARADALRWVLEQVPDCGIGPDDCCNDCDQSNYYLSIVNEERARLCAIIEKELSK